MIKGKEIAKRFENQLDDQLQKVKFKPCLAMILVSNNPTLAFYLKMKSRVCHEVGINVKTFHLIEVTPLGDWFRV